MAEKQEILVANLTLDTYQKNNIPPLVIPQGDYGARVIRVRITEQGRPVTVTTSEAASIVAERIGDGESKAFSGTVNEDGTVNVPVTQWMLDLPDDDVICHVVITGNDYQYSTTEFLIEPKQKANPTEISKDDPRQDIVTEILANESARQAAEATRRVNETGRETAEDAREEAEAKRLQDEERRTANEALRVTAESEREAAEDQRDAAESERAIAEAGRKKEIETLDQRITKTEKRLTNIEQGVMADTFEVDDSVAYVKDVPTNALPYAAISKIGGMTYRDGDVLRSASTEKVDSVGKNLASINSVKAPLVRTTIFEGEVSGDFVLSWDDSNLTQITYPSAALFEWTFKDGSTGSSVAISEPLKYSKISGTIVKIELLEWCDAKGGSVDKIQFKRGTERTPYTPYVKHTLPIPAEVRPAHGINNEVYDYLDFGEQESVKRVGVAVFDGSADENWEVTQYTNLCACLANEKFGKIPNNVLCDRFDAFANMSPQPSGTVGIAVEGFNEKANTFFFGISGIATNVAEWRAYLAANPVTVVYELAEPIVTDISDILPADNLIGVEGGGTITMVNEHEFAVPSEIIYQVKGASV